jgi:mycothiol S-conjugate amidase
VPCGDYFEIRDRALLAHATQVDPDGPWFHCPLDLQRKIWPTEDFELARVAPGLEMPTELEDDLFAGVHEALASSGRTR